jgi:asparagine synthase (glutamine-hydrolysing)
VTGQIPTLRKLLSAAVKNKPYEGILFSGGLDTSILAALTPEATAVTISLEARGRDIGYSRVLAKRLGMKRCHYKIGVDEAVCAIPDVIRALKSFDPALPNDLVVYFGLRHAGKLGMASIATGDAGDELFAGYSFMRKMPCLEEYIKRISGSMSFSSNDLAEYFGIRLVQPYLAKAVKDFALRVPVGMKIKREGGKIHGKWILRKAFEGLLPAEIIWQDKRPLEYGSGMHDLRAIISRMVSDKEYRKEKSVKFLNREHYYYYKIYRSVVGGIPGPRDGEKECRACGAGMKVDAFHCRICGSVTDWRKKRKEVKS